jgi:hypothetical protein
MQKEKARKKNMGEETEECMKRGTRKMQSNKKGKGGMGGKGGEEGEGRGKGGREGEVCI